MIFNCDKSECILLSIKYQNKVKGRKIHDNSVCSRRKESKTDRDREQRTRQKESRKHKNPYSENLGYLKLTQTSSSFII